MRYGSVCSGIEAATTAWHTLGWTPAWFAEIDPFCSAVLAHHYPGVPNHGDFTKLLDPAHPVHAEPPLDVLVGGTPCQDFSTAGLRAGIEGERGNLTLDFCRLVGVLRPRWVVWENVPGVLSSDGGRAMGAFTGALAELGYGFAWRVLDAQYFGLAQRRKRVFVVGRAGGEWERAGEVLLEPEGLRGDPPARHQAREVSSSDARGRAARGGGGHRGNAGGGRGDGLKVEVGVDLQNMRIQAGPAGTLDTTRPSRGDGQAVLTVDPSDGQEQAGAAWCYAIQDVRQISKQQNGRGWSDEGTSCTLDRHSTQGIEFVPPVAGTLGGSSQQGGFRTTDLDNSGAFIVSREAEEQISFSEIMPTMTSGGPSKSSHNQSSGHMRDGYIVAARVVAPPLTATNDPSRSPQSSGVTSQVQAVLEARLQARAFVRATNPHSCDEAPRWEEAEVAACLNVWDERHSPPKHIAVEQWLERGPSFAFQTRIARNGRGQPEPICPTLNGASSGATSDMRPCIVHFDGVGIESTVAQADGVGVTLHGTHPSVQRVASFDDVAQRLRSRTPGNTDNSSTPVVLDHAGTSLREPRSSESGVRLRGGFRVRRLTPRECERLQGFPDDYTLIPYKKGTSADSGRYKALGNSMAVPVMRWIGQRIALVDGAALPIVLLGSEQGEPPLSDRKHHPAVPQEDQGLVGPADRLVAMRESGPGWWMQDQIAGTLDRNMGASGHGNRVATIFEGLGNEPRSIPESCSKTEPAAPSKATEGRQWKRPGVEARPEVEPDASLERAKRKWRRET